MVSSIEGISTNHAQAEVAIEQDSKQAAVSFTCSEEMTRDLSIRVKLAHSLGCEPALAARTQSC
jgi:hypothetical protein